MTIGILRNAAYYHAMAHLRRLAIFGKAWSRACFLLEVYPIGMTRKLNNWTYEDVTSFLKEKGFDFFDDVPGIGKAWMNFRDNGEPNHIVEVKYTYTFYTEKTLKRMIRQSGIAEEDWLKWTGL